MPSFRPSKALETEFRRRLRQVAREIKRITTTGGDPFKVSSQIVRQLRQYTELIGPWALAVAENIVLKANRINLREWNILAKRLHRGLASEYASGSRIAVRVEDLTTSAAKLITSLPYDAALQVEAKVEHSLVDGTRADELRDFIDERGDVAWSRADLIARTEVSRQSSVLTQARAEDNGSIGYIWHTAEDGRVRPSHAALDGVFIRWDRPPLVDDHYYAHAGQIFNCRCWPEPVFDLEELPKGTPMKYDKDFDEGDHPRDEEGKFTSGGESSVEKGVENLYNIVDDHEKACRLLVSENANIEPKKLAYSLNSQHEDGKHKAKVFEDVLGYNESNSADLEREVRTLLKVADKRFREETQYGKKFEARMFITGPNGRTAPVLSGWIVEPGSTKFRMTSLYVDKRKGRDGRG